MKRTAVKRYAAPRRRRKGPARRGPAGIPADEWRNPAYLDFLRSEGKCVVCHKRGCDPCHGPVNGTSSKGPDAGALPMCRAHHDVQTVIGWPEFERGYGFSREIESAAWFYTFKIWKEAQ